MKKIQNTIPNIGEDVGQQEFSFIPGGNAKWYSHFGRHFGTFLKNWMYFYHRINSLQQRVEKTCIKMFYHNFIHYCQNLKATKHSGEWINNLLCIQTTECYSTLNKKKKERKEKELSSHEKTWRNHKCILLNERSQSEKATYYMIPTKWHPRKLQRQKYGVKRSAVAKG